MTSDAVRRLGWAAPTPGELELLRAALLPADDAAKAWRRWLVDHDIDRTTYRSQQVLAAISANLPADVLGAETGRLQGLRKRTWLTNHLKLEALGRALDVLRPLPVPPIVAKGAAIITSESGDASLRSMFDSDVVVRSAHYGDARALLRDAGWTEPPRFVQRPTNHSTALVDAAGHELDFHRWIVFPRFAREVETEWYERTVGHEVRGRKCERFDSADETVLAILHGLSADTASSARWPLDVAQLADEGRRKIGGADRFWGDVMRAANEVDAGRPVGLGLGLCRAEFGLDVPTDLIAQLSETSSDRYLEFERWLRRRGVPNPAPFVRKYIDVERHDGRRPTPYGFVRFRMADRGDLQVVARRRWRRARAAVRMRRHRERW